MQLIFANEMMIQCSVLVCHIYPYIIYSTLLCNIENMVHYANDECDDDARHDIKLERALLGSAVQT